MTHSLESFHNPELVHSGLRFRISLFYLYPDVSTRQVLLPDGGIVEIEQERYSLETRAAYHPPGGGSSEEIVGTHRPTYEAHPDAFAVGDFIVFFIRDCQALHVRYAEGQWRKLVLPSTHSDTLPEDAKTHLLRVCKVNELYQVSLRFQMIDTESREFVVSCNALPKTLTVRFKLSYDGTELLLMR